MTHNTTARIVWRGLKYQFLGNRESSALIHSTEFYIFYQDDLSINDYCCLLKTMADDLGDVGDRTLSLTAIQGLNEKFGHLLLNFRSTCSTSARRSNEGSSSLSFYCSPRRHWRPTFHFRGRGGGGGAVRKQARTLHRLWQRWKSWQQHQSTWR